LESKHVTRGAAAEFGYILPDIQFFTELFCRGIALTTCIILRQPAVKSDRTHRFFAEVLKEITAKKALDFSSLTEKDLQFPK
jgi:hypothetical protein